MLVINRALYTPICKQKTKYCFRSCRIPQPNCDRLVEWIKIHGYQGLHSGPSTYYIYWSDLVIILKRDGEDIPVLEGE